MSFRKKLAALLTSLDPDNRLLKHCLDLAYARFKADPARSESFWRVLELLEDHESKIAFEREMYFKVFGSFPPLSPCSPLEWARAEASTAKQLVEGSLPRLRTQEGDAWLKICTTCFTLEQYQYAPHVRVSDTDVFIDGGGYIGDTAIWAARLGARQAYSFEPMPENRAVIEENKRLAGCGNIAVVPFALGEKRSVASFAVGKRLSSSSIVEESKSPKYEARVEVTDLDGWCLENDVQPTYIKLDIEGAEPAALRGARRIITRHRPKLAICLYHERAHMKEIPLLLKDYCAEYRFWCKKAHHKYEFIFFATV